MSFTFDSDTKERVRAATDIVDLLGGSLELRRQGANYVALCPWHPDSRPSLQINQEKQIWKCWVCDIGGDVFAYVMRDQGLTFPEALKKLADEAGITLAPAKGSANKNSGGKRPDGSSSGDIKSELYRCLAWAERFYNRMLRDSTEAQAAREYLKQRNIHDSSIEKFAIGFAPDSWAAIVDEGSKANFSRHVLESAGMIIPRDRSGHYDRFRNRIMFPIRDRDKRTIAFGGRVMPGSDDKAKYINSPETRLFHKSQQLYGFDIAFPSIRHSKTAIVMEGYTDVIVAHQFGIENCVAVLGTALGSAHLKLLRHYCDRVVLLLDGDEAGQRRSDDVLELFLSAQMDVRVVTLPEKLDPADFLQKYGGPKLQATLDSAVDALEFKMRRVSEGFDPLVDTHRATSAIEEMLTLLAKVPHSGLLTNEAFRIRQNQILPRLARQFSIPEDSLRERLSSLRTKQTRFDQRVEARRAERAASGDVRGSSDRYRGDDEAGASRQPQRLMRPGDLAPFERELLELIIVAPQVAPIALERVQSGWLECEAARHMLAAYEQLEFSGQSLEFESVLTALEDPSLKSLLVTLHEQANAKLKYTSDSAEDRLRVLTHRMGEQQDAKRRIQLMNDLQSKQYSEEDELNVLQNVIRQARLRQGLVGPQSDATGSPHTSSQVDSADQTTGDVPTGGQSPTG